MINEKVESCEMISCNNQTGGDGLNDIVVKVVMVKKKENEKPKTLRASEVIKLVKEKFSFVTKDVIGNNTLSNVTEERREGTWILLGTFNVPKEEKWLYENPDAINSVNKGLEQAGNGEFVVLSEVTPKLLDKLGTLSEEKELEMDRKINKVIESKSVNRRKKAQKEE